MELSTLIGLAFAFLSVVAGFMQAINTTDLRLREIYAVLIEIRDRLSSR